MSLKKTVWQNAQRTLLNMLQFHGTHLCCYLMKHQRESVLRLLPFSATIRLFVRCLQALSVSTRSGKVRVLADDYLKIMWWLGQLTSTISDQQWSHGYLVSHSTYLPRIPAKIQRSVTGRERLFPQLQAPTCSVTIAPPLYACLSTTEGIWMPKVSDCCFSFN